LSSYALSPTDAATVGNIFGTPVAEWLSVPLSRFLDVLSILKYSYLTADFIFGNIRKPFGAKSGGGVDGTFQ
jgi:hypothetical protein